MIIYKFNRIMESISTWLPAHESYTPLVTNGIKVPLPVLFLRLDFSYSHRHAGLESFCCLH